MIICPHCLEILPERRTCKYCGVRFSRKSSRVIHEKVCPYKGLPENYKFCRKCGKSKPTLEFHVSNVTFDKLNNTCKKCKNKMIMDWKNNF